ncbi:phytoene desaturase family protein [Lentisalinibacter sediminis]|uniref:phytoene desaturase family protein n=1 Tax=Lentisalinibacter sediminis TaxID=2992237 RepID=UPI00386A3129
MSQYDSIVIGAGHNGLVCAAYLARGGQRVLVLEAGPAPGGLASSYEFHPGFHVSPAHSLSHFSERVIRELGLLGHGFEPGASPLRTVALGEDGRHVTIGGGRIAGAGTADEEAYRVYLRRLQRYAKALSPFWHKTMPRIGATGLANAMTFAHLGLNLRRMGRQDMQEFLRIASLPTRDLMDELFASDLLKAALSWDGLIGGKMAPRSPNGAVLGMLYRMAGGSDGEHAVPANGIPGLVTALEAAAKQAGTEIRYGARVKRIRIDASEDGLTANGVRLADGTEIGATRIVSAADPQRTFLDLVGVDNLEIDFTNRIRRLRCEGYVGKLHLALHGLPEFRGLDRPHGRMIIAPTMDAIEFAFDDAKYGDCPSHPVMEIVIPSLHDPSAAPDDRHVLSAHVMYVPHRLRGGWSDEARDRMRERSIDTIARYAPDIRAHILHAEFLTPADIEARFSVTGGHWHHTEFAMDQLLMMRPTYGAAQYATPVPGLFLCGAGSHPGGDLTGAPGRNAAREILG